MKFPWTRKPAQQISASDAAKALCAHRAVRERNRIIDTANEMRARMGMTPIPRRPQ